MKRQLLSGTLAGLVAACASQPTTRDAVIHDAATGATSHRGHDDLLSAGLGLAGLRADPPPFADPLSPTPAELRRRAIHASWRGIADLGPLGGFDELYGALPLVPGREFTAFLKLEDARSPHRIVVQVPDAFDLRARCLVVAPASGSRGVYGAIALAGTWGLPRGCAVAYTDKGAGSGWFDLDSQTGVTLDGRRAGVGEAGLEFAPDAPGGSGVAVKHAHSGDNPEANWGRHVLQTARFALSVLDEAFPAAAPFTPANTRIIATGLSNGGGAVLQAAGLDGDGLLDGVVALEPNVHLAGHGRPLFDYVTEAALYLPCALLDPALDSAPMARLPGRREAGEARCRSLHEAGLISGRSVAEQARAALAHLRAQGWGEAALATAASTTALDLWRSVAATYVSAYLRTGPLDMPCGYRFAAVNETGAPMPAPPAMRAAWWSDASGIPPGAGVALLGGTGEGPDAAWPGLHCLRGLWDGDEAAAHVLRQSVAATAAALPRKGLPVLVAHGSADGLLPIDFSSRPYVETLRHAGLDPVWWEVPHAQHFDAFLALPGFGEHYVPLLPWGLAALDALWRHLDEGTALPPSRRFDTRPRGAGALEWSMLGLGDRR